MKAYCLVDDRCIEVEQADEYVKCVDMDAEYMSQVYSYTLMLMPCYEKDIPDGFKYMHYLVNGTLYQACYTSKHEQLVKYFSGKVINEQLSLFDF